MSIATSPKLTANDPASDLEAAVLEQQGVPIIEIAARFEPLFSVAAVKAAIARGRHQQNQRAAKPTPVVRPAPQPSPPAPEPTQGAIEQLLAWAESNGPARAATLAARTRAQLKELTALRGQQQATAKEREVIALLERQLADARQRLRGLTGAAIPRAAAVAGSPQTDAARIRAWAAENGHTVPPRGKIAKAIVEAYLAAQESGAD